MRLSHRHAALALILLMGAFLAACEVGSSEPADRASWRAMDMQQGR